MLQNCAGSLWCYLLCFKIIANALALCSFRPEMQNYMFVTAGIHLRSCKPGVFETCLKLALLQNLCGRNLVGHENHVWKMF